MNFNKYYFIEDEEQLKKQASSHKTAQDFLKSQNTGFIRSGAYDNMQFRQDIKKTPKLIKTIESKNGEKIEFRQTGEKLMYVKHDDKGELVRDQRGLAVMMSDDEIKKEGLNTEHTTVYAFNSKGNNIGYASDEFGSDGVWVKPEYQKQGIGTELLITFKKQFTNDHKRKIGQMTSAGMNMTRSYWRKLTGNQKPELKNILKQFEDFVKKYDDNKKYPEDIKNIRPETPEYMRAYTRFTYSINADEKTVLEQYFYPDNFNPEITLKDFYERYKK